MLLEGTPERIDGDAFDALAPLAEARTDRIVVVDGNEVVGTISQADLITAMEVVQGLGDVFSRYSPSTSRRSCSGGTAPRAACPS